MRHVKGGGLEGGENGGGGGDGQTPQKPQLAQSPMPQPATAQHDPYVLNEVWQSPVQLAGLEQNEQRRVLHPSMAEQSK